MKTIFIYFCKIFLFPIVSLFLERVEGRENLPEGKSFILASNHINSSDHFFISLVLEDRLRDVHFIGALDEAKTFIYSVVLYYLADTIAINRRKVKRGSFVNKVTKFLKAGKIIVIYPEGDTGHDKKNLLKGKTGIAELVLETGVPVIPVGIRKSENSSKKYIKIGKPLYFLREQELAGKIEKNSGEYYSFLRKITDEIMKKISILCGKIYPWGNSNSDI